MAALAAFASAAARLELFARPPRLPAAPFTRRRGLTGAPVSAALDELHALADELKPQVVELRVRLYEIMLAVLAEAQEWSAGLTLLAQAFSSLPSSAHQPLWEQKVL